MVKVVSRILEEKEAIYLVLSADCSTSNIVLTWKHFDVLQAIDSAISPSLNLNEYSTWREVHTYVTISAILAMLHVLKTDLLK